MTANWRFRPIAIIAAAIALVMLTAACGDSGNADAISGVTESVSAQGAEIAALSAQIGGLQSEIADAQNTEGADVAELRASIEELRQRMDTDDEDDERIDSEHIDNLVAELDDINATVEGLDDAVSENADAINSIPDAMGAIATALISEHADEHDGLEAAIQQAFDEHGVSHGELEDTLEEVIGELLEEGEVEDEEITELIERLDWLEQAAAPAITQAYVDDAIRYYNRNGRQATLDYYNTMDSVDGDLYLFALNEDYELIVHPTVPTNIGMDIRGPLGTDITGKNYGSEFVGVDEEGKWVDYVYLNPTDDFDYERKHAWIVRHDGLIFGSGWYERDVALDKDPATYTRALVHQATARYDALGRDATVAYYNAPESVDGQWYVFIGDENDVMIAHATVPENVGKHFDDVISPDGYPAGAQVAAAAVEGGAWTTYTYLNAATGNVETKHSWVTRHNGMIFGSGWYEEGPPKTDLAAYTQAFVQRAINLYNDLGREGAVAYYNSPESIDGQFYVFAVDADDLSSIANPNLPDYVGRIPARIDPTGYYYGGDLGSATEEGKWISYVIRNPETGVSQRKHTWVALNDGIIWGSGWYEPIDSLRDEPALYVRSLVDAAIERYESDGLDSTVEYYNSPESVDGHYYVFIADENDVMIAHATIPANVGKSAAEIVSPDGYPAGAQVAAAATEDGAWTSYTYLNPATGNVQTKHSWVIRHDGRVFGSGWYEEGPSKSEPAEYVQSLVQRATNLYDDLGRDATLDYYNSPESADGPWYVFVLEDREGVLYSVANSNRPDIVGTTRERIDANGFNYGEAIAAVTEAGGGEWINYLFTHPQTREDAPKHSWVVRRDNLFFGAGWYEGIEE